MMSWNEGDLSPDAAPLWRQIADRLRRSIATGEFRPGDVLPSEAEINAAFQVSRATARASLERLRQEGLISRHSGRGSIVLAPKVEQPVNELASFSQDMRRRGLRPSYSTFSALSEPPRAEAAEALGVSASANAFHIRRLLLADDEPIGMSESWLAPWVLSVGRQPTPEELDAGSLYEWLARVCGQRIAGAKEYIEAALADAAMARRLEVAPGSALLVARRRSHAADGRPIEYATMHYRADRYRFIIELAGSSASQRTQ
jgi:GntR family transcriptional regulator